MRKVIVGLSGGVDSAVAAWLLKSQGYQVSALFMKNWEEEDDDEYCSSRRDLIDAAAAADVIGIELEVVNLAAEYRERVFADFLSQYAAGLTPNPDVLCNSEIKFDAFRRQALELGAELIATGHYARRRRGGAEELLVGADPGKDQSYFLHRLDQEQLSHALFPVGDRRKTEVRALARRIGLPVADKKDSTGICFIGERPFRAFLSRYLSPRPGPIRTVSGEIIGQHDGLCFHTIGQRRGLGIGGRHGGDGRPWYVVAKDPESDTLVVSQDHDDPRLLATSLRARDCHWISGRPPRAGAELSARTRYRSPATPCRLRLVEDDGRTIELDFPAEARPWAVTPGQSAVLYDGEVCLGGGFIQRAWTVL